MSPDIDGQLADIRAAVSYARSAELVDPRRIALWGTSFGGGHVITVAARDPSLAAVVAQVPHLDFLRGRPDTGGPTEFWRTMRAAVKDEIAHLRGRAPFYIPVMGDARTTRLMTTPGVSEEFLAITPEGSIWRNEVSPRIFLRLPLHRPIRDVGRVTCPILFSIGADDVMTRPQTAIVAARRAHSAQVQQYPCNHFGVYLEPWQSRIIGDQSAFLREHLAVST